MSQIHRSAELHLFYAALWSHLTDIESSPLKTLIKKKREGKKKGSASPMPAHPGVGCVYVYKYGL